MFRKLSHHPLAQIFHRRPAVRLVKRHAPLHRRCFGVRITGGQKQLRLMGKQCLAGSLLARSACQLGHSPAMS
jgi:hypothetical protein